MLGEPQAMFGTLFQEAKREKEDEWEREEVGWVEGASVACFYETPVVTVDRVSTSNILDQAIQFERHGR